MRPGAPELTRGLPSAPRSAPGSGSGPRSQTQAPGSRRAWGPKGPRNLPPCSPHRRTAAFVISLRPVTGSPDSPVSPCSGSGFLAAPRGRGCFPASPERRAVSLGCTGWGGPGAGDSHPPRGLRPGRGGRTRGAVGTRGNQGPERTVPRRETEARNGSSSHSRRKPMHKGHARKPKEPEALPEPPGLRPDPGA